MSLFPRTLSFPEENAENLHNLFTMKIFKKKKKKAPFCLSVLSNFPFPLPFSLLDSPFLCSTLPLLCWVVIVLCCLYLMLWPLNQWRRNFMQVLHPSLVCLQKDSTNTRHFLGTTFSSLQVFLFLHICDRRPSLSHPSSYLSCRQQVGSSGLREDRHFHLPGVSCLSWPGNASHLHQGLHWMGVCDPMWPVRLRGHLLGGLLLHNKRKNIARGRSPLLSLPYSLPGILLKNMLLKASVIPCYS